METAPITNYKDLKLTIIALRAKKEAQEAGLKITMREFVKGFDLMAMVKSNLRDIAEDKEVRSDLMKIGLHAGTNFLIKLVANKFGRAKMFMSQFFGQRFFSIFSSLSLPAIGAEILSRVGRNAKSEQETIDYANNGGLKLRDTLADEQR